MMQSTRYRMGRGVWVALGMGLVLCGVAGCRSTAVAPPTGDVWTEPVIRPGFVLSMTVTVAGRKEVEEPGLRVSNEGLVEAPLLGAVKAGDLTLRELGDVLEARYAEFFVAPRVSCEFVYDPDSRALSPWGSVTVLGRVKKPGRFNLPPTRDLTVSAAIQLADGFDTSANMGDIRVTRTLPNGETQRLEVDLNAVGSRGSVDSDAVLMPGDVVFVPELFF